MYPTRFYFVFELCAAVYGVQSVPLVKIVLLLVKGLPISQSGSELPEKGEKIKTQKQSVEIHFFNVQEPRICPFQEQRITTYYFDLLFVFTQHFIFSELRATANGVQSVRLPRIVLLLLFV